MKKMMRLIKKALKNPKAALLVMLSKCYFLSDCLYIKLQYFITFGRRINLKNPKTFNEKLNWLKLNDRNPQYPDLVDKYKVRSYIKDVLGEEYLIPLLGVWDSFDEIDFDSLPNQFVLKCTHDSGSVVICKDKANFDIVKAKEKINRKMNMNLHWWAREWVYKDLKPRIIAEKYMEDLECKELRDYKFFCFSGSPQYVYVSQNLADHANGEISFYDMDFNLAPFSRSDFKTIQGQVTKPKNFEKMKEYAKKLSNGKTFLRVDFYEVNGAIYFGELTFFPAAGYLPFEPNEWDGKLGELIDISGNK